MERLTYRTELGVSIDKNEDCPTCSICWNCDIPPRKCKYINDVLKKLADYEDLEEQGLLLRLPCKVGDTVYLINSRYTKCTKEDQEFNEYSCQGCEWLDCDSHKEYYIHTNKSVSLEWIVRYSRDFGKTVFLTKSEAEQKLKEMENK